VTALLLKKTKAPLRDEAVESLVQDFTFYSCVKFIEINLIIFCVNAKILKLTQDWLWIKTQQQKPISLLKIVILTLYWQVI